MTCDACRQPYREGALPVQTPSGLARICAHCQNLPFAMVWRMLTGHH